MADPVVGFSDERIKASIGEVVSVDIVMDDFPSTEGSGVCLHYTPAAIDIKGVAITEVAWDLVNRPGSIDNAEGQVMDILFSSYAGVSGEARTATLHGRAESLCSDIE